VKRAGLAIATVLLLAAPVVVLSALVRGSVADDVTARSTRERLRTSELAAALLDNELDAASGVVREKATNAAFVAGLRDRDVTRIRSDINGVAAGWPQFTSVLALDPTGSALAFSGTTGSASSGTGLGGPAGGSEALAQRDYFVGALAAAGPFVSEAYQSNVRRRPVLVAVSIAVRDADKLVGVLAVTVSPAELLDALMPVNDVPGRQLLVVDKNHHVVASSDPEHPPLATADLPDIDRALGGSGGTSTAQVGSQSRVVTYTPVARAKWALYVIDDPSVVLAVERDLQQSIAVAATAALILALAIAAVIVALFATLTRRQEDLARSQRQLLTTNLELETATRHKSEFLSSMSHELRTPLNAILGFSDLLDEQIHERITDRQRRYFQNIREAGEHLLSLINDVLDLSKVESGRIELRPEIVTVQQVLEPVLANARHEASQRGLHFESSIQEDASVWLDPGRVRQILYNLTSNALKFTPRGGAVAVRSHVESTDLVFEVSDTGIGIPEDRRDRVFGIFERVNEDRSEASGTGLGLALSRRLVEMYGGAISFTSGERGGTTFRVLLPNVVQARRDEAAEVRPASALG